MGIEGDQTLAPRRWLPLTKDLRAWNTLQPPAAAPEHDTIALPPLESSPPEDWEQLRGCKPTKSSEFST
eukprot:scaffold1970_cov396-Prasinococcus_capsulatus_cf.AAC.16